jgi:hypothetical protein
MPNPTTGKIGLGQDLNGTTDYAWLPFSGDYQVFTMSAWFNPDDETQDTVISYAQSSTVNNRVTLSIDNGSDLGIWDANNSWFYSGQNPAAGNWYYVAGAFRNTPSRQRKIQFDGSVYTDTTVSFDTPSSKEGLFVGREDLTGNEDFNGQQDEIRFSDIYREDSWLKFEYHNIGSADNEITISAQIPDVVVASKTRVFMQVPFQSPKG